MNYQFAHQSNLTSKHMTCGIAGMTVVSVSDI